MISVTIGSPSLLWPFPKVPILRREVPGKHRGEVRGLKAPPRSIPAPEALTLLAMPVSCSSDSTEQDYAITWKFPPPILMSPISTTVSSGVEFAVGIFIGFLNPFDVFHNVESIE